MDAFELVARITLNTDEYDQGLKAAENRTSRFADVLKANLATDAIRAGFKGIVSAVKGATTAIGGLVKSSVQGYADFEQMVGGVKKLYGNMGQGLAEYVSEQQKLGKSAEQATEDWKKFEEAQNMVLDNAREAYKTSGMSMNQYMEVATSFSASLINSLSGDTVKAAEMTDTAMKAISDNFNTFGGDISMIQGAFQGFAKQNYTMLDNLKLGYGGTKTEMERLIADANEYAATIGEASDMSIDSFADIVRAIDLVQQKQQIAGTTAREASTTIAGSFQSLKAAWQNLLTGFADPNADMTGMINDVVSTAETLFGNLIPVVEKALSGMAEFVTRIAPIIADKLPGIVSEVVPAILSALSSLVQAIVKALPSLAQAIADVLPGIIDSIISTIDDVLPSVLESAGKIIETLIDGLTRNSQKIVNTVVTLMKALVQGIAEYLPMILEAGAEIVLQFVQGIIDALPDLIPAITKMMERILDLIIEYAPKIIEAGADLIVKLAEGLVKAIPKLVPAITKAITTIIKTIVKNAPKILKAVGNVIKSVITEVGKLNGVEGIIGKVALAFGAIKLPQALLGKVSQFTGGITNGFGSIFNVLGTLNSKFKAAEGTMGSFFSALKQGASDGFGAFQLRALNGEKSIGTFFSSLKDGISASLSDNGFGSLTDKVNNFSSGLSIAAKGLLAFGGGATSIMGVSDSIVKLSEGTDNLGGSLLELGGSIAASAAQFTMAFGFPGGLIATGISGIIGLAKGLGEVIRNFQLEKVNAAMEDINNSIEGASHTLGDYATSFDKMTSDMSGSLDRMNERFDSMNDGKSKVDDLVTSIGGIGVAMTDAKNVTIEQVEKLQESLGKLKDELGSYIDSYYDYAEQQMYADIAILKSQGKWTEERQKYYAEQINAIELAKQGEIAAMDEVTQAAEDAAAKQARAINAKKEAEEQYEAAANATYGSARERAEAMKEASKNLEEATAREQAAAAKSQDASLELANAWSDTKAAQNEATKEVSAAAGEMSVAVGELKLSQEEMAGGYTAIRDSANDAVDSITETYTRIGDQIRQSIANANAYYGEESQQAKDHAEVMQGELDRLEAVYQTYMNGIQYDITEFASKMPEKLLEKGMNPNEIQQEMMTFSHDIYEGKNGLEGHMKEAAEQAGTNITTFGKQTVQDWTDEIFNRGLSEAGVEQYSLKDNYQKIMDTSLEGLDEYIKGKAEEIGHSAPEGFTTGASDLTGVAEAGTAIADEAINATDAAMDINSPSHVYQAFGASAVEGFNLGVEENMASTTDIMTQWADEIAENFADSVENIIDSFRNVGKKINEAIKKGLSSSTGIKEAILKPLQEALSQIKAMYAKFKTAGANLGTNLKNGINEKIKSIKTLITNTVNQIEKLFKSKNWKSIGKYIAEGIEKGIQQGRSKVIEAAVDMATKAYQAAKAALEISSPSKKMKKLGKWLAYGLAEGIANNENEAVQASEEMASKVLQEAQRVLDNYKAFHATSLEDEVHYWKKVKNQLQKGTQAYSDAVKTIRELRAQLEEQRYTNTSINVDDDFAAFMEDSQADLQKYIKRLKQNGTSKWDRSGLIYSAAQERLDNYKVFNEMTQEEERDFWVEILKQVKEGTDAWYDINAKIIDLNEDIEKSAEEFAKKLEDAYTSYYEGMEKVDTKYATDREKLESDLQKNLETIHNKEIQDIDKLEQAYENAVNSRKNSIMSMTGLYDRVNYGQTWNKDYLLETLQSQVDSLNDWDFELDTLESKLGRDNPLLQAIEDMGVSGLYTLKEINGMSADELEEYSRLYAEKSKIAQDRAVQDNRKLRESTNADIAKAHADAAASVADAWNTYNTGMSNLKAQYEKDSAEVMQKFVDDTTKLKEDYKDLYDQMNTDAKDEMTKLTTQIKGDLTVLQGETTRGGKRVGNSMIDGMKAAIEAGENKITKAAKKIAKSAYEAAMAALDAHSPSRKFMYVGEMVDEGFMMGINRLASEVQDTVRSTFDLDGVVSTDFGESAGSREVGYGGFVQNLTVNSPIALNPSEVARQTRLMNQQMVLALRGAG